MPYILKKHQLPNVLISIQVLQHLLLLLLMLIFQILILTILKHLQTFLQNVFLSFHQTLTSVLHFV
nr:MAG TPA: hypothetical protein [Caudoviricetes sp.]